MTISSDQPSPLPPTSATSVPIAEQHFPVDGSRFLENIADFHGEAGWVFFNRDHLQNKQILRNTKRVGCWKKPKNSFEICESDDARMAKVTNTRQCQIQRQKWIIDYHWCHRNVARIVKVVLAKGCVASGWLLYWIWIWELSMCGYSNIFLPCEVLTRRLC